MASRLAGPLSLALGAGLVAGAGTLGMALVPLRLDPGGPGWARLVRGSADGVIRDRAVLVLPGLERHAPLRLVFEGDGLDGLAVAVDGKPAPTGHVGAGPLFVIAPAAAIPGVRLDLRATAAAPPRLRSIAANRLGSVPLEAPVLAFAFVAGLTAILARRLPLRLATALGLLASALVILFALRALVLLALPAPAALAMVLAPVLLIAVAIGLVTRADAADRRRFVCVALLLAAAVFGAWVRWYFLPSTGSWDTEYWKAWMLRAASQGVARVYGDADAVPDGHFLAQFRGEEELWKIRHGERDFVVDYPPLAMALWESSWWAVTRAAPAMDYAEAQNVAVKLPAILGDALAVLVLLLAFRDRPRLGATLAAIYWVAPVSWLSSAVLGYLDGAFAPLVVAALICAGRGRAVPAGALLALACLVKPTGVIVAPAAAVALLPRSARVVKAILAGLVVVALFLVPFVAAGTLATAIVHCYWILRQGNLSGGYPNLWWLAGHVLTALRDGSSLLGPVKYAHLDLAPFPPRPLGTALFALTAVFVALRQKHWPGPGPATLAGAVLFFAYSLFAVGVHENHPHPLFLLLLATGLGSRRLRFVTVSLAFAYVLDMLALSGLGRFYGLRYVALEPLTRTAPGWRMALGIDLTLPLIVLNLVAFAVLLRGLDGEMQRTAEPGNRS